MSTSKKATIANANAIETVTQYELQNYLGQYSNVSIRRLASATDISYAWMLKVSKKPIEGEAYDPNAINYQEIAKLLSKKDVHLADLPWNEMNSTNPRNSGKTASKDLSEYPVGSKWFLRGSQVESEIVYSTATNVVLLDQDSTVPKNLSWDTFFQKGPAKEYRPITKRKSDKALEEEETTNEQ